ncbi:MAG: hypothetical protein CSA81_01605 [Acidobacteria bacterium]|nr:MAG: hypothetical protein CSA81_01605 [Acidobacteriota bacterium]
MKKIVLLIMLACLSMAFAGDKKKLVPKVYGRINLSYGMEDINDADAWKLKSHSSRFGIKGSYDLTDTLKAVYKMEWGVDVADVSKASQDHIKSRNQFVGLAGNFGTIMAGRHDTPTKMAQGKMDLFNDAETDIKTLTAGEIRANNVLAYASPKLGGSFSFVAAVIPGEGSDLGDGPADVISANITYNKDGLYAAVARDQDLGEIDITRLVLLYKVNQWQVGGLYELVTHDEDGSDDHNAFIFNAAFKTGNTRWKVQYGDSEIKNNLDSLTVGVDYIFNKKAFLYAYYATMEDDLDNEKDYIKFGGLFKF